MLDVGIYVSSARLTMCLVLVQLARCEAQHFVNQCINK